MKKMVAVLSVIALASVARGDELGRESLSEGKAAGLGRGPLPEAQYDGSSAAGTWGTKVSIGWAKIDWSIGSADGSESRFVPQASLFYKVSEDLDVNISALLVSAEDQDSELGNNEADVTRLALGARYWANARSRVQPYLGAGIGYYLTDASLDKIKENGVVVDATVDNVEDAPGAFVEGGAAFQVADNFFVNADVSYDFLLTSADVKINDKADDFDVTVLSFNLGVTLLF